MSQMVTSNNITPDLGTKRKRKKVSLGTAKRRLLTKLGPFQRFINLSFLVHQPVYFADDHI